MVCLNSLSPAAASQQACTLPISPPPDQTRVVFLLDTSGSMEGRGNSVANIFPKVKGAMLRGMRANTAPGSVELLTFNQGPQNRSSFAWPAERGPFERTVNTLSAPGANTWLYSSMEALFSGLEKQPQAATTVYVVTDGLDNNPSKAATVGTALRVFDGLRGPLDKLYYVALGQRIPGDIKAAFAGTTFARAIELPAGQTPDLTAVALTPSVVTVGADGSFPFQHPENAALTLESGTIGGAAVSIRAPQEAGKRVNLDIRGTVPASSVGYMCARIGDVQQNVLLRFGFDTPPPGNVPAPPVDVLGTLLLLNPGANLTLQRGQSAVLEYKAVNGPVTVELASVPGVLRATLPDQTVSLLEGERVRLSVTDQGLANGQQAAPTLRLNDSALYAVPKVTGKVVRPFPWWWLLLGLTLLVLALVLLSRARRTFTPYALSVTRRMGVALHERPQQRPQPGQQPGPAPAPRPRPARRKSRRLRKDITDIGDVFREPRLRGLTLAKYRPEIRPEDEVLLDNSNVGSLREYSAQRLIRAARLETQPDTLRLHKDDQTDDQGNAAVFLAIQETLEPGQLYILTDYIAPPVRVRPPMPPPEPPAEVIVTLLSGLNLQEFELPPGDVDLADVFTNEHLRGLVVCREPGLLRLRALGAATRLRHISREFRPGEALPLSVMLDVTIRRDVNDISPAANPAAYQLRIRSKTSAERYGR